MSNYIVYIRPRPFQEIKSLPGNMRQRVRQAIRGLGQNPRPSESKQHEPLVRGEQGEYEERDELL
ncbi:MAG: hypothetical protein ACRC62_01915 [Microcoleus sp.]